MHKKNIAAFLALSATLLISSCAKEGPTGPTGLSGPSFTGTISGHVSLYDKYGSQILTNLNIIRISIAGSAPVVAPATNSDVNGFYQYPNLITTGTYSITATDTATNPNEQFASTILTNVNFVSGTLNRDIKLSKIPDSFLVAFTSGVSAVSLTDSLVVRATADARRRNCIIFANRSASATGYLLHYIVAIPANTTSAVLDIPQQDLLNAGFAIGDKVYYSAYSYVVNDASVYENTANGQNVYTAVYPRPLVDSTVVP